MQDTGSVLETMDLPPRVRATQQLRQHLEKFDWSGQTPGRRHILKAFLTLATTKGYSAVTMRTLSKEINIKPPSLYSHFPGGRDEIVAESLRWHYYRFGMSILEAVDDTKDADEFWDAMVRVHIKGQLERPENELWDMLVATDRMGGFLQPEVREDVNHWLQLYAQMYEAAAQEMGYEGVEMSLRVISTILDGASSWCGWSGKAEDLDACADRAIVISRSVLALQLTPSLDRG